MSATIVVRPHASSRLPGQPAWKSSRIEDTFWTQQALKLLLIFAAAANLIKPSQSQVSCDEDAAVAVRQTCANGTWCTMSCQQTFTDQTMACPMAALHGNEDAEDRVVRCISAGKSSAEIAPSCSPNDISNVMMASLEEVSLGCRVCLVSQPYRAERTGCLKSSQSLGAGAEHQKCNATDTSVLSDIVSSLDEQLHPRDETVMALSPECLVCLLLTNGKDDATMFTRANYYCAAGPPPQLAIDDIFNEGCDWDGLPERIAEVDSVCCFPEADPPSPSTPAAALPLGCLSPPLQMGAPAGSASANQCTVQCAVKLVPLLNGTCGGMMHRLFDGADGVLDGRAAVLDQAAQVGA